MKRKTLLVIGLGALTALTSCGEDTSSSSASSSGSSSATSSAEGGSSTSSEAPSAEKYTYRSYVSGTPTNWNPHTWEDSGRDEVSGYTEIGFVDFAYDPDNEGGYVVTPEMAEKITDATSDATIVTDDFKEKWGIEDGETGRVWKIDLNKSAKFASGKEINAQTYVDSMELLLNSQYKNYRANSYYSGDCSIVHAFNYYNAGERALTNLASVPEWGVTTEETYYLDFAGADTLFSSVFGSTYKKVKESSYVSYFTTSGGVNLLEKYTEPVVWSDEIYKEIISTPLFEGESLKTVQYYCASVYVNYNNIGFDEVGLVKWDEYSLLYITENEVSEFYFDTNATETWLVNPDLYKSLVTDSTGLKTSSYGTASAGVDGYDSYGPYKLTAFEQDKQMKFTRNENWYGWTDGKHEGQYQTTDITVDVYKEHASALLAFEKGDLDAVSLDATDMAKYGYSDYLKHVDQTYTMRLVFDSNLDDLKELEKTANNGKNKQILSLYSFRKAISLAIDRTRFNSECTAGNKAAYALLNTLYYYNVEEDPTSIYRNTPEAKKAVVDLYGIEYGEGKTYSTLDEAYEAVTGLDVEQAKTLFIQAYNEAIEQGIYTNGQDIELEIGYYDATTATNTAQTNLLMEFVDTATEGTPLEGKISFKGKSFTGSEDRYDAIGSGHVEIANCAWGGAAFYPFSCMRVYCDPSYTSINEIRSFDPTSETLEISYDGDWGDDTEGKKGTTRTMTYQAWSQAIGASGGAYYTADVELKLHILSCLENALLNLYNFAVLGSYASVSLDSMKVEFVTDTYNIMYGFGGLRYMTYKYNDAAWAKFVSDHGGSLNYQ